MSGKSRNKKGERHAQIPLDALRSEAFRWLPNFAVRVLVAMAAQFSGYNNGGLELTANDARAYGINEDELFAGIRLLIVAGFVRRTVLARRRSGKGSPARYAITWRTLGSFPRFDIVPTVAPSRDWLRFVPPFPAVRSLNAAEVALGRHKPRKPRLTSFQVSRPRSKRVPDTHPVIAESITGNAPGEKGTFAGYAPGEVPDTHPAKNHEGVH